MGPALMSNHRLGLLGYLFLGDLAGRDYAANHPFADGAAPFSADKPLMCCACRDETVFFSLFGLPDIFRIDEAGLRSRLSSTYQGAELDEIIRTFRASRPGATPAQLYFAITRGSPFGFGPDR
ncbi:carboxylesterase type B [Streptomyces aurantiacus]|uniref:hypothetical protein n=1 Tax=Streptomyces aurantiacus TaxID=47760 RepID=UPI0027911AC5|nr:hypothetical protein [Streptomyces aurantiacus]MDQ0772744.1 carboxylesterase type B [Streptomyces aurantiacus]